MNELEYGRFCPKCNFIYENQPEYCSGKNLIWGDEYNSDKIVNCNHDNYSFNGKEHLIHTCGCGFRAYSYCEDNKFFNAFQVLYEKYYKENK